MATTAVYAGTFDPVTNGHLDVVARAARVFGDVLVSVADHSPKQTLFSAEERAELIRESLPAELSHVQVQPFSGLLVDHVRKVGANVIIRGLRAVSDYEYEAQMALLNRRLNDEVETAFFMTSERVSFISSSVVKEIASLGGDVSSFVPEAVQARLSAVYKS